MNIYTIAKAIAWMYNNLAQQEGRDLICAYALLLAMAVQEPAKPRGKTIAQWHASYEWQDWRGMCQGRYDSCRSLLRRLLRAKHEHDRLAKRGAEREAQRRLAEQQARQTQFAQSTVNRPGQQMYSWTDIVATVTAQPAHYAQVPLGQPEPAPVTAQATTQIEPELDDEDNFTGRN